MPRSHLEFSLALLVAVCWSFAVGWGLALPAVAPVPTPAALTFPPEYGEALVLPADPVDGDTINFYYLVRGRARLHGIDAPEMTGPDKDKGKASRAHLAELLPKGPTTARLFGKDKFGRALVDLLDAEGVSLSERMIADGFGKPWDGTGPKP